MTPKNLKNKEMKKAKEILMRIVRLKYKKYILVIVLGVILVGFLGEDSITAHLRYKGRIAELEEEKARYEADCANDQAQIHELQHNPKAVERIARERYFMKMDDEDVFILSDDEGVTTPTTSANATVE